MKTVITLGVSPSFRAVIPKESQFVEQRLHQRRTEKSCAPFALKAHPKCLFQRRPHGFQRRRITRRLDTRQRIAGLSVAPMAFSK